MTAVGSICVPGVRGVRIRTQQCCERRARRSNDDCGLARFFTELVECARFGQHRDGLRFERGAQITRIGREREQTFSGFVDCGNAENPQVCVADNASAQTRRDFSERP